MAESNTRDHLANERTFLAWVRTSIALIGLGVVIAKLRFLIVSGGPAAAFSPSAGRNSTLLGLAFAVIGLLALLCSYVQYNRMRRAIDAGDYRADGGFLLFFASILFLLGLLSVAYLLALLPR